MSIGLASAGIAAADPITPIQPSPNGSSATAGQPPVVVVAVAPGGGAGQPTLVVSPPTDAQPADPSRVSPIGGAKISSSVPNGMGPGNGKALQDAVPRTGATLPVWARNGIFVKTAVPGKDVTVHLPDEMLLEPADWGPNGIATYAGKDGYHTVVPLPDGGIDVTTYRTNPYGSTTSEYFLKIPKGAYSVKDGNNVLIKEGDKILGVFLAPGAKNSRGTDIPVAVDITPLNELRFDTDQGSRDDYPVEVRFAFHPALP